MASETYDAATVILLRDGERGLETLMLRRNSKLDFAGGMWVFPGGRVDQEDRAGLAAGDDLGAARRAAVREAREESGLVIDEAALVAISHWTPPDMAPKRFLTWFFVARAPEGDVAIDQGEIHAHSWVEPAELLRRRNALEVEILPPTWVTLEALAAHSTVEVALAAAAAAEPLRFHTRIAMVEGGSLAIWQGDAAYDGGDPHATGGRNRLWMLQTGWRYERS
jgi:8-oxo-dGTP pyrophosphatase MutT (NUDIX family)